MLASDVEPYAYVRGQLDDLNIERQRQEDAQRVVRAFANTLAEHDEMILDARLLQHSKAQIYDAFDTRIAFLECSCDESSEESWKDHLEHHRALRCRVSDFQDIDAEDEDAVAEANKRQMEERRALLLVLKYHQRAMKEDGLQVENPVEQGQERIPFSDLARRMLDT